jgi:Mrp family chromosome partitioning ATPase
MANFNSPNIVTAIADSNFEGSLSSNLHSQGWDIIARAVDFASLTSFLSENEQAGRTSILIYAPDLPDFTPQRLGELRASFKDVIGYGTESEVKLFENLLPRPTDATELISQVRGIIRREFREPLISQHRATNAAQSKVIAIASAGSTTGATTLALNLAMESSLLEKRTLLIDGNSLEPSIAIALELRNLRADQSPRLISPLLWAYEVSEKKYAKFIELMANAYSNFDLIIIDLGSISNLSMKLTDRRWSSGPLIWSCDNADELWISSRPDEMGRFRLLRLIRELAKTKIKARLTFIANLETPRRKSDQSNQELTAEIEELKPLTRISVPRDNRAAAMAAACSASLSEASPKSNLRKSISRIASEL